MIYYYGSKLSENITETPEGYLIARNVPIARTGEQIYTARELGLTDGDPERPVRVFRHEADVFDPAALASFEGKDVTDGHPPEQVAPENHAAYSKGHVENVRRDGDHIVADLHIKDANLISEIRNRVKREVSCGYLCNYEPEGDGYRQTNIRGNHVAVVPKGRAGKDVAIKDSADTAQRKGAQNMSAKTKAWLRVFGMAAKDAEPEALDKLTDDVAAVLDAEPAEKAQEAEPAADVEVERAPKGDDLGSKLDRILERLETLEKRVDGKDEEPPADEKSIDEAITALTGGEDEAGASEVIEDEEKQEDCDPAARDAAVAILKAVRPAVAAIEDRAVRASVADALISAVRSNGAIKGIQAATVEKAKAAADEAAKTKYEKICADQQTAYDGMNPHKKKKEA